jgi:hypothetical protein
MNRRHFLVDTASSLSCCLLPEGFIRRVSAALEAGDPVAAIAAPPHAKSVLFAEWDDYRILFSLDSTETEPERFSWRKWAERHDCDIEDHGAFREFAIDTWLLAPDDPLDSLFKDPDEEVPSSLWDQYLESAWAISDSPQAQAFHYLSSLSLGNRESAGGDPLGELKFYEGPMPGSNWTWVETDSELVLPALQRRLLELGEDVRLEGSLLPSAT